MTFPQDTNLVRSVPLKHLREQHGIADPDYFRNLSTTDKTAKKAEGPAMNAIKKEKK
jgi:hypothetical protein